MPPADELPLAERVARLEARNEARGAMVVALVFAGLAFYLAVSIGLIRLELPARG